MSPFRSLDQAELSGKRVLVRLDLNVPMENGRVTDATRIERQAQTVTEIAARLDPPAGHDGPAASISYTDARHVRNKKGPENRPGLSAGDAFSNPSLHRAACQA
jgi:hypothetical protein